MKMQLDCLMDLTGKVQRFDCSSPGREVIRPAGDHAQHCLSWTVLSSHLVPSVLEPDIHVYSRRPGPQIYAKMCLLGWDLDSNLDLNSYTWRPGPKEHQRYALPYQILLGALKQHSFRSKERMQLEVTPDMKK
jgi:hypothetical protein